MSWWYQGSAAVALLLGGDITPGTASLQITTFAPTVSTTNAFEVPTAALTVTAFAPTILTPVAFTVPTASITITTYAPNTEFPLATHRYGDFTAAATVKDTGSFTPNADAILLAFVDVRRGSGDMPTPEVKGTSGLASLFFEGPWIVRSSEQRKEFMFAARVGASPSAGTIRAEFPDDSNDVGFFVEEVHGPQLATGTIDQVIRVTPYYSTVGTGTSQSFKVQESPDSARDLVLIHGWIGSNQGTITPGTGWTGIGQDSDAGAAACGISMVKIGGIDPSYSWVGATTRGQAMAVTVRHKDSPHFSPIRLPRQLAYGQRDPNTTTFNQANGLESYRDPAPGSLVVAMVESGRTGDPTTPTSVDGWSVSFTQKTGTGFSVDYDTSYRMTVWVASGAFDPDIENLVVAWPSVQDLGVQAWFFEFDVAEVNLSAGVLAALVQAASDTVAAGTALDCALGSFADARNAAVMVYASQETDQTLPSVIPGTGVELVFPEGNDDSTVVNRNMGGVWRASNASATGLALQNSANGAAMAFEVAASNVILVGTAHLVMVSYVPGVEPAVARPGAGSLTITTFAPEINIAQSASPGSASLTVTTFAPTVTVLIIAEVPVATLTVTTFAPTAEIAVVVAPGVASLTVGTFAPTVLSPVEITVGSAALTLTAFSPTVETPVVVEVPDAELLVETFAPDVGPVVEPGVAALTVETFAPTVETPVAVTPGAASLLVTAFEPTASTPVAVTPGVASLSLTAFAPTIINPVTVTIPIATLSVATFAPDVLTGAGAVVPAATLTLTTFEPTAGATQSVTPGTANITLTAFAPLILVPVTATPGVASLLLTAFAPDVGGGGQFVEVPTATLTLISFAPEVLTAPVPLRVRASRQVTANVVRETVTAHRESWSGDVDIAPDSETVDIGA